MSFPKEVTSLKFSDCLCGVNGSLLAFKCYSPNSASVFSIERHGCLGRTVWDSGHCHIRDTICCINFAKQGYLSQDQMCCWEAGGLPNPLCHICTMEPHSHSIP